MVSNIDVQEVRNSHSSLSTRPTDRETFSTFEQTLQQRFDHLWYDDFWGNEMPMWIFGTCGKPTQRGWTNNSYRPFSVITLILDRVATLFFFPSDVTKHRLVFHFTNVALQFINVLLASMLAQSLFRKYMKDTKIADKLGSACALVFGLHPVRFLLRTLDSTHT